MLTPQEVSEHGFQKASFGGYNMSQVDEFLDIITGDYGSLYSENAVLKGKMKVLVEKVEEYRSTEEAMRKALMAAQRMADDLICQAQEEKERILQDAEAMAREKVASIRQEREEEQFRLSSVQRETAQLAASIRAIYASGLQFLDNLDELCPPVAEAPQVVAPDPVDEAAQEIDESVQKILAQAMADATALREEPVEEEPQEAEEEDEAFAFDATRTIPALQMDDSAVDFGDLEFGREYEIR